MAPPRRVDTTKLPVGEAIEGPSSNALHQRYEDGSRKLPQRVHRAFNIAAAKIEPLKWLIADREHSGLNSSALKKLLKEAEAEKRALEKELASMKKRSSPP
jgi:hypothetical protein